ncbi:MgtC/SapB family protein [Phenylobacterium sp. J426]|uniref:MgtC/SapB family protein n=1 Tax=Phenylobacterium sp. J426 TaxID=2898439 RepID=UPI002150D065|nr:MgtC/SapB family protein [Phenylobacterium sp. J426]MCR5876204.1 MgtC/SapB family protein [Phenylobacterium sp. J426]
MDLFDPDLLWPIAGAILAGGIIGIEREYRSSPAGFRTHILVCLSSALLMLAAVHQVRWLTDTPHDIIRIDPVRMAHGVLTGIGFLCGGVIFREGFTVRGLTTAASLWTTSALGVLFGVGFYALAIAGGAATLLVLAAVALTERLLPQRRYADLKIRYSRQAPVSRRAFCDLLAAHRLKTAAVNQAIQGDTLEYSATVEGFSDAAEALLEALRRDPEVIGFECQPHKA